MDNQNSYEQLIASKLEQITVPDMADAIWDRIKTQLDLDMPADDGDGSPKPSSPIGPKIIGWGLSVVIVALITVFLTFKNKPKTKVQNQNPVAPTEQINQPANSGTSPPGTDATNINPGNSADLPVSKPGSDPIIDSFRNIPNVTTVTAEPVDSFKVANAEPKITLPPITDSVVQGKKRRGVSGLNDNDYRIVPKKDST